MHRFPTRKWGKGSIGHDSIGKLDWHETQGGYNESRTFFGFDSFCDYGRADGQLIFSDLIDHASTKKAIVRYAGHQPSTGC